MKRLFNRIYYFVESWILRGTPYQVVAALLVVVAVSVFGGWVVFAFSPQFNDFSQAVWWAFLRLTDSGYLGSDTGALPRTVSTVLTMMGFVIFTGALIAILTNGLSRFMSHLASGRSKIFEKEHILIIGWHQRLHAIVEELVRAKERVTTQLGRVRMPAIVVLVKEFRPDLLAELRDKLPEELRDEARILLRSGNPLEAESLERVDFSRASSIILLSQASSTVPRHFSDMTLVKILMSLRAQATQVPDHKLPNVVLDIAVPANKILAESVGWHRTEAIAGAEFMSRLLCQSLRHPGLSQVYLHLLTDMYGESLHLIRAAELGAGGQTIRQIAHNLERAIPIGFLKSARSQFSKEDRLRLMQLDEPVAGDDELICVAPSIESIADCYDPKRAARLQPRLETVPCAGLLADGGKPDSRGPRRILLVGWSNLVRPLIEEIGSYHQDAFEITLVTELEPHEVDSQLRVAARRFDNIEISVVQSGLNSIEEVRQVRAEDFDNIALLSPEFIKNPLLSDAETVMAFVLFDRYLKQVEPDHDIAFLAELNDEDNQPLLRLSRPADILITQEIVSHLLSQVAVRRALAWVYEELFTFRGSEISFRSFQDVLDLSDDPQVTFDQCQEACLRCGRVAIGYKLAAPRASFAQGVHMNPRRDAAFVPGEGDRLIVVEV